MTTLLVSRDVDGYVIDYEVEVPARGLVDAMRVENCKPGVLLAADPIEVASA
jgi:hypothetical protein